MSIDHQQQPDEQPDHAAAGVAGGEPIIDELGDDPDVEIVVDGRRLNLAEIADLFDKPLEELTDAEREALQPFFDAAQQEKQPEHVQADPLELAGQLLVEALAALRSPTGQHHSPGYRLAEKIALGHAFAAHAHAVSARVHAEAVRQQLQLMLEQRALTPVRPGGPSSIVVPTVGLRRS